LGRKPGKCGQLDILEEKRISINALIEDYRSALFGPARFGFATTTQLLLDSGIDSRFEDKDGRTAFSKLLKYDKVEVLRLVIENLVRKFIFFTIITVFFVRTKPLPGNFQ
jgi:ankyrin repeat protein